MDATSRRVTFASTSSTVPRRARATVVFEIVWPVALFGFVIVSRGTAYFHLLVGEDGILEWAGVAALAVSAWALLSAAARTSGRTRLAFIGCGAFVVAAIGEELDWGAGWLWSGVGFIESHNGQGENTLHNLPGMLDLSFLAIVATSVVLAVLIVARWEPLGNVPLTVVWWLMVPAIYEGYRLAAGTVPYWVAKSSEAGELVFSVALARISLCALRQCVKRRA